MHIDLPTGVCTSTYRHLFPPLKTSLGSNLRQDSCLLEATNRNGLFFFLIANLLTGAVNLSMQTVRASPLIARAVVTSYMLLLSTLTAVLHAFNITLRYW